MADETPTTPPRDPARELDALHHMSGHCRNDEHADCVGTCDYGDHPCLCVHHA